MRADGIQGTYEWKNFSLNGIKPLLEREWQARSLYSVSLLLLFTQSSSVIPITILSEFYQSHQFYSSCKTNNTFLKKFLLTSHQLLTI